MDHIKNIGIMTAPRPNDIDYLSKTLVSLFTNAEYKFGIVHIFNGSREVSYLDHLRKNPRIQIHNLPNSVKLEELNQCQKCCVNHFQAFKYFADLEEGAYLFEDDVLFTNKFFDKIFQIRYNIEKEFEHYCLSLYTPINATLPYGQEIGFGLHPRGNHFGSQGYYLPSKAMSGLFNGGFYATSAAGRGECVDMLVQEYFDRTDNLFFAIPSLLQHIGNVSSGNYGPQHKSFNFTF